MARTIPKQQLLDYLSNQELLLVLDNFEQLLSSPEGGIKEGTASGGDEAGTALVAGRGYGL